ncbi:ribbon-helix-helix protein, CopG family [Brucella intermedia]|uniref:ribbon-helix-helix protein, CopG family n=1 Tax=Brucella TaxID=234 RepID=UPI001115283A|nr:ribbon-helix-helix protein, CopG family [Brucella intermedia]
MIKKPFTTRLDIEVLALAQQLADAERRSVTAIIEVALIEYAERRGLKLAKSNNKSEG